MKCPVDGTTLLMMERQGIEIDYCPECRGVWLDRGELDKIIERENDFNQPHTTHQEEYKESNHDKKHQKKKKSPASFLGDLLEF